MYICEDWRIHEMRYSFKVSISSILAVLIFITQFVTLPYLSWYNILKYGTIVLLGIYVGRRIKIIFKRKYLLANGPAFIFSFLTVFTAYLNRGRPGDRDPFLASIPFVAAFLLFLLFMEIRAEEGMVKKTLNIFYKTAFVISIIMVALIFFAPSLFAMSSLYFIGTKFSVVYLHLLLIVLYLVKNPIGKSRSGYERLSLLLLIGWSFFIGVIVNCSTGIVGVFILLLLILIIRDREKIFLNGAFYSLIQLLCLGFVFFYEFILRNSTIQHIIVDFLGRDVTLTSRTFIYERVPIILTEKDGWLLGMGYGSSYDLGIRYGGFPDTQNGILEWIWQVGIPTTIIMILMFAFILSVAKKYTDYKNRRLLLPLIAGVYLFTILGTIEITIEIMYFSLMVCTMSIATGTCEERDSI